MKNIICYKCNEENQMGLYGFARTLTHGRGKCVLCHKAKLGIILEKNDRREQNQEAFTCPHCGEKIEYLRYSTNGYEYGSESLETGDMDSDGFESTDSTEYACPECDDEISYEDINKYRDAQTKESDNQTTVFKDQRPLTE